MSKELILWSSQICPFAHRARIALREKKLDVLIKEIDLYGKTPEFTEAYKKSAFSDPTSDGKVPILQHGDLIFAESDLISWYVAEAFPDVGNSLLPNSPF